MSALESHSFHSGIGVLADAFSCPQDFNLYLEVEDLLVLKKIPQIMVVDWSKIWRNLKQWLDLCEKAGANTYYLYIVSDSYQNHFLENLEQLEIYRIFTTIQDESLQKVIMDLIEKNRLSQQEQDLLKLVESDLLQIEYDIQKSSEGIELYDKQILDLQTKIQILNHRISSLQRSLVAVQQAKDIEEMEILLTKALSAHLNIEKVSILIGGKGLDLEDSANMEILEVPLLLEAPKVGKVLFSSNETIKKTEENFLKEIAEVVSIAVDRHLAMDSISKIKDSWESTFKAIPSSIVVIDSNYSVVVNNKESSWNQKKCYEALFGRKEVCKGCRLGKKFHLKQTNFKTKEPESLEVSSQKLLGDKVVFVNTYKDVSENLRLERQRIETSKRAELGIISSSIAHELNNPLSGVISFIQILKMEKKEDEYLSGILDEMEEAALRCKQIIQNLLSFTRMANVGEFNLVSVRSVIEKVLTILQVKTKAMGVDVLLDVNPDIQIVTNENLLSQVIMEVIKNSVEDFEEAFQKGKNILPDNLPKIEIRCRQSNTNVIIDIIDNGLGISPEILNKILTPLFTTKNPSKHRGLGLSTAYQILQSLGGDLEIFSASPQGVQVRIVIREEMEGDEGPESTNL